MRKLIPIILCLLMCNCAFGDHTYVSKWQVNNIASDTIIFYPQPASATTLAILSIVVEGVASRTGAAPTIASTTASQIGTVQIAQETNIEMWYVAQVFDTSVFQVTIPNTASLTCHSEMVFAYAGSGIESILEDFDDVVTGGADNGGTATVTSAAVGDFLYSRVGCGEAAPASLSEVSTDPVKTTVYESDHGTYTSLGVYGIEIVSGVQTFEYVWSTDDGCIKGVVFASSGTGPAAPPPTEVPVKYYHRNQLMN